MHRKAKVNPGRRRRPGFGNLVKKTAQNIGADLFGLACRLLIVTFGLGAALGIAAIFDVYA